MLDFWILTVLVLILIALMWIGAKITEMREELYWFKDDNFAGHLLKGIKEVGKTCEGLERDLTEIDQSLGDIHYQLTATNSSLDELKEVASTLQQVQEDMSSR